MNWYAHDRYIKKKYTKFKYKFYLKIQIPFIITHFSSPPFEGPEAPPPLP